MGQLPIGSIDLIQNEEEAQKYNLNGWVMNCNDKSVEFIISGEKNNIDKFVKECYVGPIFSNVNTIDLKRLPFLEYKNCLLLKI